MKFRETAASLSRDRLACDEKFVGIDLTGIHPMGIEFTDIANDNERTVARRRVEHRLASVHLSSRSPRLGLSHDASKLAWRAGEATCAAHLCVEPYRLSVFGTAVKRKLGITRLENTNVV